MDMPRIDNAFFGSILVDGKKYETDLHIHWDGEIRERQKTHNFTKAEFEELALKDPEVIVIGTGMSGMLTVGPAAATAASLKGIQLLAVKTPEAAQRFNALARMRKRVIAVLHATC